MKEFLKSVPKFMYVIFVVLILVVILICIPFDKLEKKGNSNSENIPQTEQIDNSGDIGSINDKIKQDNEALGVSGEEISTEEESKYYSVDSASEVDSIYSYEEIKFSEVDEDLIKYSNSLDVESINFKHSENIEYLGTTTGVHATIDMLRDKLIDENSGYIIAIKDLVYICSLDDNTMVCRLSELNNDIVIIKCIKGEPDSKKELGELFSGSYYIGDMRIDEVNGKEVLLITYEGYMSR